MEAAKLYAKMEKDFIKQGLNDDWIKYMKKTKYLSDNFKKRSMGVVCDNSKEIRKVLTAVFPSDAVLKKVAREKDALLFVHHPEKWDITNRKSVFQEMNQGLLKKMKKRRDSIYNLHSPLDNFSAYSTGTALAEALNLKNLRAFAHYNGGLAGVIGKTRIKSVNELSKKFSKIVGHRTSKYIYDNDKIRKGLIAVVGGGGNSIDILEEIAKRKINTFVTGITVLNDFSRKAHDFARENRINLLGGTHYSTEKFACIKMCTYFRKLGIQAEFVTDKPGMKDM